MRGAQYVAIKVRKRERGEQGWAEQGYNGHGLNRAHVLTVSVPFSTTSIVDGFDQPNRFDGKIFVENWPDSPCFPLSINEILLRGVTLKNTGHIIGVVVYTGPETRIMQNSTAPPSKQSSFDRFINRQLFYLVTIQLSLTIFCAAGSVIWEVRRDA